MISRAMKETFYRTMGPPMRLNGWIWRKFRAPSNGSIKVHLGPGQQKYIQGWYNVDANLFTARIDIWADLRNPLPFKEGTVDCFYSHHMIEHLPVLSESYLTEIASAAGFVNIARCSPVTETRHPDRFTQVLKLEFETTPQFPHTILIEAEKPR